MNSTISLEEIYAPIEPRVRQVPQAILDILSGPNELASDVIRYFFSATGKMLRPALVFLGSEIKGADPAKDQRLLHLASAFEIFHAATLIHDDIIDSAYLRRSLPTVHIKWSPEIAVLVGDYLHDKAIGAIFQNSTPLIVENFLHTAGQVCDGEIQELKEKGNYKLSEAQYTNIVDKKTAVLLACALESGARLAGATETEALALRHFGRYFGIAFQIVDDCLDFTGEEQEFGKTLGADCAAGVLTLPLIRLLEMADAKRRQEFLDIFQSGVPASEKVGVILAMVREHGTLDYSLEKARGFCDLARRELTVFPDNPGRRSLERLVDYVLERNR